MAGKADQSRWTEAFYGGNDTLLRELVSQGPPESVVVVTENSSEPLPWLNTVTWSFLAAEPNTREKVNPLGRIARLASPAASIVKVTGTLLEAGSEVGTVTVTVP